MNKENLKQALIIMMRDPNIDNIAFEIGLNKLENLIDEDEFCKFMNELEAT